MNQFKRAQCILLPTNKAENTLVKSVGKLYFFKGYFTQDYLQSMNKASFHLYLLSDDEIKEGDWYYNSRLKQIFQAIRNSGYSKKTDDYKIIATTDTSLTKNIRMLCKSCGGSGGGFSPKCTTCKGSGIRIEHDLLPQPSQQFIEKYIESYNCGKIITDVLVVYESKFTGKEYVDDQDAYGYDVFDKVLKVNPKDNTITIKKLKDSWNREELIQILEKFDKDSPDFGYGEDKRNKWIEKNL